jgi:DNA-binding LytR/AlgR family response regulator
MSLRTLIVDDEPKARQVLREGLELIADIEVVGEAESGSAALEKIAAHQPNLVLLDLQMPVLGGLDVIRRLKRGPHVPAIVVVTAHDAFALEALEAGAVDYLLKPVGPARLAEAVARVRRVTGCEAIRTPADPLKTPDAGGSEPGSKKIVGRAGEEFFLLSTEEICALQADGAVVWILTANGKYQADQTLKVLQERLQGTSLQRVHRNAMVNLDRVRKISPLSSQRRLVTLTDGREFVASKRQARRVRQLLHPPRKLQLPLAAGPRPSGLSRSDCRPEEFEAGRRTV